MPEEDSRQQPGEDHVERDPECPFCSERVRLKAVATHGSVLAIPDAHPVAEGHCLVITRRHTAHFFTMRKREKEDALELLDLLRVRALRDDSTVTGFNVGANCGVSAGQQVPHAHLHFIPRRDDNEQPERGVKGVIRNKISY